MRGQQTGGQVRGTGEGMGGRGQVTGTGGDRCTYVWWMWVQYIYLHLVQPGGS